MCGGEGAASYYCFKYILKCILHEQLCMNHRRRRSYSWNLFRCRYRGIITAQKGLDQHNSWHLPLTTFLPISSVTVADDDSIIQSMGLNVLFILKWWWQLQQPLGENNACALASSVLSLAVRLNSWKCPHPERHKVILMGFCF